MYVSICIVLLVPVVPWFFFSFFFFMARKKTENIFSPLYALPFVELCVDMEVCIFKNIFFFIEQNTQNFSLFKGFSFQFM